jgi:hypothetical protein
MSTDDRSTAAVGVPATLALLGILTLAPGTAPRARAAEAPTVSLLAGTEQLRLALGDGERLEFEVDPGARFRSAEPLDDGWIAAGVRDDEALLLVRGHAATGRPERLPTPAPGGALVAEPVPLVRDGRLAGLAWLAGDGARSLGVRHAEWLGDGWGPTETVSTPGPGSQLALAGATLPDDEVLLLWSAYDGSDDEVVWSLRSEDRWSEPARIAEDNRVPDITPALALLGGEPVAAWSRYDGNGYRLMLSRRSGGSWSAPRPHGPPGSLFPRFVAGSERAAGEALLLHRNAGAGGWTVLRLDGSLRITARARVESPGDEEPVVVGFDAEGVEVVVEPGQPAVAVPWVR